MSTVEILIPQKSSEKAFAMLSALKYAVAKTNRVAVTQQYKGDSDWLILYGVGAPERDIARKLHVHSGRHALLWDLAYFERLKYLRCSIDHDHPQAYLDRTDPDPKRWDALGIKLREDAKPDGHIVLVGIGRKSRAYLHEEEWERLRLMDLRKRFPGRDIVYRPKPASPKVKLDCRVDESSSIEHVLKGAAFVSCRHSNVACDAAVAGVLFEASDGAAVWLQKKAWTPETRLDFLRRLAWWQWMPSEAEQAWAFVRRITEKVAA